MQNLKKTASMVDGQVGYHRPENVRRCKIAKNNTIVRQLEKTKRELHPDLAKEQQDRLNEIQKHKKAQRILEEKQKKMEALERKKEQEARSYDRIMGEDMMTSNSGELLCFKMQTSYVHLLDMFLVS
jgi:phenylalanyl-tRNA synthetase alpha subunit